MGFVSITLTAPEEIQNVVFSFGHLSSKKKSKSNSIPIRKLSTKAKPQPKSNPKPLDSKFNPNAELCKPKSKSNRIPKPKSDAKPKSRSSPKPKSVPKTQSKPVHKRRSKTSVAKSKLFEGDVYAKKYTSNATISTVMKEINNTSSDRPIRASRRILNQKIIEVKRCTSKEEFERCILKIDNAMEDLRKQNDFQMHGDSRSQALFLACLGLVRNPQKNLSEEDAVDTAPMIADELARIG